MFVLFAKSVFVSHRSTLVKAAKCIIISGLALFKKILTLDSLVKSKIIAGGMIPKIQACVAALDGGAKTYIVDGRLPGALTAIIKGQTIGTRIG